MRQKKSKAGTTIYDYQQSSGITAFYPEYRKENERKIEKDSSMIFIWYDVHLFVLLFILFLRLIDFLLFMDILNMDHH